MARFMNVSLAAVLAAALALTGACANIADDRARTQTEGTLAGAGIGAGTGALIGGAIGGRDGALKGAGIGAILGGLAGLAYGTSVADKKANYASQEEWLAACLTEAKAVNKKTADLNSQLKTKLAGYNKQIGSAGQSDQKQLGQAIKRDLKDGQQNLAALDHQITSQQKAIDSSGSNAQTKALQQQVDEMKKQKRLLEKNNKELAAISNRIAM